MKKARDFLPFLQKTKRHTAVVEYVFSGHRLKLYIPKETCSIAFAISGVRAPARNAAKNISEPYSDEALAFMRRKVLQRDVEIEVETVDRTGTFLGSIYDSKKNVALSLVEEGLAKLQTSFGFDRIPDSHLLVRAEQNAKQQKKKVSTSFICARVDVRVIISIARVIFILSTVLRFGRTTLKGRMFPMVLV